MQIFRILFVCLFSTQSILLAASSAAPSSGISGSISSAAAPLVGGMAVLQVQAPVDEKQSACFALDNCLQNCDELAHIKALHLLTLFIVLQLDLRRHCEDENWHGVREVSEARERYGCNPWFYLLARNLDLLYKLKI